MRRWLSTVVVSAVSGALAATAAVAAFPDTANSPFATEIDHIGEAGCATGFPDGTFRPRDPVNRQQFAAWMNRCGGRVEYDRQSVPLALTGDGAVPVAEAAMTAGAVAPGGGFVVATATFGARDATAGGEVTFQLEVDGGGTDTVPLAVDADTSVRGSAQLVVPVPGDATQGFTLTAQRAPGVEVAVDGSLVLLYVPFAGDGTGGAGE